MALQNHIANLGREFLYHSSDFSPSDFHLFPALKISDSGLPGHEFDPSTTKDPPCTVKWQLKGFSPVLAKNIILYLYQRFSNCGKQGGVITLPRGDEADFWLNGYVNKQNCRIWSEANPQVYVETPLHSEKLILWCALWAGGILLQER
ncbi:hypothetical protein TNCV_2943241 [Trichonephila clavipes]|nr:hypothetical protein TNCV_2943241 [Trichonephila clavipes]